MPTNVYPVGIGNLGLQATAQPTIQQDNDTNLSKWVAHFADAATQRVSLFFPVPPNVSGNVTIRLRWRANATTGSCMWSVGRLWIGNNTGINTSAATVVSQATAVTAVANQLIETTIVHSGFGTGSRFGGLYISRLGTDGSDTLTVDAVLEEVSIEFPVDQTFQKGYILLLPLAAAIPAGSTATKGTAPQAIDSGATIQPTAILLPDNANAYADWHVNLPANFGGGLTTHLFCHLTAGALNQTSGWQIHMGAANVGAAYDPALTLQTTWTITYTSNSGVPFAYYDLARAAVIMPSAGQNLSIRVQRDNTDTLTVTNYLMAILLEFTLASRSPQTVHIDPATGAQPVSVSAAAIAADGDTNTSKWAGQYDAGAAQALDFQVLVPTIWGVGSTLRLRWRSAATGGNVVWRADWAYVATSTATDPVLTSGSAVAPVAGSGLINETTIDISSGAAAGSILNLRVWRTGTSGSDTCTSMAEILDLVVESTPA